MALIAPGPQSWFPSGQPGIDHHLDAIQDHLTALGRISPILPDDAELGDALVQIQSMKATLCSVETGLLAEFDRRRAYRADGSLSTAAWLAGRTPTPKKESQGLVRLAKRLRHMPLTRQALEQGEIDRVRAEMLARRAWSPRQPVRDAFVRDEVELVDAARTQRFESFCRTLEYWDMRVDPDGAENQAAMQADERRLHLSQSLGGMWFLEGQFDPVSGAILAEGLDRIYQELFAQDWADAQQVHGDATCVDDLARTPAQRRADALVVMAIRSGTAPADGRQPRPLLSILVGYETFAGPVRELFNGTVLTPGQIAPLLTEADIERVVFDPRSRDISDLGRKARLFNAAQRRVIELQQRTCFHPTCDVPAEKCQMDHIQPWSQGGETNIANGRPGCDTHNRGRNRGDQLCFDDPDPPPD